MSHTPFVRFFALLTLITVAGQGCHDSLAPGAPTAVRVSSIDIAPLVPRIIAPQETDPAIDWIPPIAPQFNHHYVWVDESRPSNGKLLVFLPGIGPTPRPRAYQLVAHEAARLGYHVISLMYQNTLGPAGCFADPDPTCFEKVRLEIIDGADRSHLVDVRLANSTDNRLTKLLLYLDARFPEEGWSKFLQEGAPKWSQIALAGHSGGATQAALIGKVRHVDRVVMIAGPAPDESAPGEAAPWISVGETPASKYFVLVHLRDHFSRSIFANVSGLTLDRFGDPLRIELATPPYDGTHILVTDLEPQGGYTTPNPHLSTAVDAVTPLDSDGTPLLRDAWRYTLGARNPGEPSASASPRSSPGTR